ncbi:MAG: cell division protein ZapA [Lactobacillales bacterium]|jgi:cell division protein ZapA|nr:cell division protein ZapA [Lactobacillales bacterium]
MTENITRYKAQIGNTTYTLSSKNDSATHMEFVAKLLNEQLSEIQLQSSDLSTEQAAILSAFNALSDQIKLQEKLNAAEEKSAKFESRIKQIEEIEAVAKDLLVIDGKNPEVKNHLEAQRIVNEAARRNIQRFGEEK